MSITLTEQEYAEAWAEEAAFEGHRRGFPVNPSKPVLPCSDQVAKRRAQVAELRRKGLPTQDIAQHFGVSPSTIKEDVTTLRKSGVAV